MQEFRVFRAIGLAFRAWFRSIVPFTALAALLYAPVVVWIYTMDLGDVASPDDIVDALFTRPVYVMLALSTLLPPLVLYRVIQDLAGQRVSIGTSIRFGLRGLPPAIVVAGVTFVLGLLPSGGLMTTILGCIWFVAAPAAVAERLGPAAALSRSADLTRGRRLGIWGLSIVVTLMGLAVVVAYVVPTVQHPDLADPIGQVRQLAAVIVCAFGLFQLFMGIVAAVSYALLRLDKDGVSHAELASVFE